MREKEFLPLIKDRLGIEALNPMQKDMMATASESNDVILLSPTGSGKTLAFLLPMLKLLKPPTGRVQTVIIAPSRELVVQIAKVARNIASGYKVTTLYGGHSTEDESNSLAGLPDIVIATPGRLLDHARRENIDLAPVRILVLDEFDKTLELGFEEEMKKIFQRLKNVSRIFLTSATRLPELPDFVKLRDPKTLDYTIMLPQVRSRLKVHRVESDDKDKLAGLLNLISTLEEKQGQARTIVFVNHRESAERVFGYLLKKGIDCGIYHGAMQQTDREKAVAMFNNGSRRVLIATDLAARGLDIEDVKRIIHYHQPLTEAAYTHRNGRSARIDATGDIYLLTGPEEHIKDFITVDDTMSANVSSPLPPPGDIETLYIDEGKKEKISKGDIAGFLIKEGGLNADEVGKIDVFDHYALVGVPRLKALNIVETLSDKRLKGKKRRLRIAKSSNFLGKYPEKSNFAKSTDPKKDNY